MSEEKCPKCGWEVAYYQVTDLGCVGSNLHIGCKANEGACLLAKKTWTMEQWEELKAVFASADEGYPGAAHERLELNNRLRDLHEKWKANSCLMNSIREDDPAACVFFICARELCAATGETGL